MKITITPIEGRMPRKPVYPNTIVSDISVNGVKLPNCRFKNLQLRILQEVLKQQRRQA